MTRTRGHSRDLRFLAWLKVAPISELLAVYRAAPKGTPQWRLIALERAIDRAAPELETPRAP